MYLNVVVLKILCHTRIIKERTKRNGGVFSRHICGAKHQAKLKVFMETRKICVSNQVMVTVSNNFLPLH